MSRSKAMTVVAARKLVSRWDGSLGAWQGRVVRLYAIQGRWFEGELFGWDGSCLVLRRARTRSLMGTSAEEQRHRLSEVVVPLEAVQGLELVELERRPPRRRDRAQLVPLDPADPQPTPDLRDDADAPITVSGLAPETGWRVHLVKWHRWRVRAYVIGGRYFDGKLFGWDESCLLLLRARAHSLVGRNGADLGRVIAELAVPLNSLQGIEPLDEDPPPIGMRVRPDGGFNPTNT